MTAALPLAALAQKAEKVFEFPVIGAKYTVTRHTKKRDRTLETSFQLRGWELIAGGTAAFLLYYLYRGGAGNGTVSVPLPDLLASGPLALLVRGTPAPGILPSAGEAAKDIKDAANNMARTMEGRRLPNIADILAAKK